jgi:predicted alpha/beta-fold hydrolase
LSNAHLQTLLGNVFYRGTSWIPSCERRAALPDGDQLVLHDSVPPRWHSGAPVALLVHGLGGTHRSGYMERVGSMLINRGLRVVRLDLRGAGRGLALARRSYHGGCSDDVRAAAIEVHSWARSSPLILIGFSLGGNIVLKLAGEAAREPLEGLEGVAALAPPVDLERCVALLRQPNNRFYETYFLRSLVQQVRRRQHFFPSIRPTRFPRPLTMRLFDEVYTAPCWSFRDALDYYHSASCLHFISRIRVPAFILAARDDPFVDAAPLETLEPPAHVRVGIFERGGHLGFLGWNGAGGIRWAEQRIVDWVSSSLAPPVDGDETLCARVGA